MQLFWLVTLLIAGCVQSVFLRGPSATFDTKVKHLLQDIEESVSKAGQDEEMVWATLFTYEGQLGTSLKREIATMSQTLKSLIAMDATYTADLRSSHAKYSNLNATAHDSNRKAEQYEVGNAATRNRYDSLQDNSRMLIALLKHAMLSPHGRLVTPELPDANGEPARVYAAIRRLLRTNTTMIHAYPDVFAAFLTLPEGESNFPPVHMTQTLLKRTIAALSELKESLHVVESQALLQMSSLHRHYEEDAVTAGARAEAQHGVEAENEEKAAELTFSIKFTSAVLKIDKRFDEVVTLHMKSNADLIYAMRDLRQAQLKLLHDITDVFSAPGFLSFIEAGAETFAPLGQLAVQAESAIHNHGDTHAILMQVKNMLDNAEPISINSVRDTLEEIKGVLRSIETDQSKYAEVKRRCDSQEFHAKEQEESLNANFALMSAAQDHSQKAIRAAQNNIKGIAKKAEALKNTSLDFTRVSLEAIRSLQAQSKDRQTILAAVQKAIEVAVPIGAAANEIHESSGDLGTATDRRMSTVQLMQTLLTDIAAQEEKEKAYRNQQDLFQTEFSNYVQEYTQLLEERRRHYESSLGVLQLHVSEVSNDMQVQQQTLSSGREFREESAHLCGDVLNFYDKHSKMHAELSTSLRAILPSMPIVLSDGAIASSNSD